MNVKLRAISMAAVFFTGAVLVAQKRDTISTQDIDEVIVVGYSKVKKESYTGTASAVDQSSVDRKSVSTVTQALAGEVAGVRVINTSGQPGTDATIRIRGFGSVNGNRSPLYVLDGAPYTGNVSAISPDDIESMTILKDATATAIYGSRGANGVVLINTKKGRSNRSTIQFESKVGFNVNLLPRYDVLESPEEYIGLSWEALYNQGKFNGNANPTAYANARLFSSAGISPKYNMWGVPAANLIDPATKQVRPGTARKYNPENWEDYAFQPSIRTENNFNMSGGSDKTTYYAGIGYLKDEGYSINSGFERYTGRLNLSHQAKDWLKGDFNFGYSFSKAKNNGQSEDSGSVFWFVDNIPAIYPLFLRDNTGGIVADPIYGGNQYDYGVGRGFGALTNAIADATIDKDRRYKHEMNANLFLEATILPWLKFETRLAGQYYNNSRDLLNNPFYGSSASQGGSIFKSKTELFSWNFLQLLRANKSYGEHTIEALVAHESNYYEQKYMSASRSGLIDPDIPEFNNATVQNQAYSYINDYALESYFGQVTYDFANKYFLSLTGRRDGTSRFLNEKWDNFYSAGIGWMVSKENFFQNVDAIKTLKLKASYGTVGDQAGVGFYPGYNVYNPGNFMGDIATNFLRSGYPDLTWERANIFQTGIEFALLKSRAITGSVDYYNKKTDNLIFDSRIAPSTGNAIEKVNSGELINSGVEFTLNADIFRKENFKLSLGFNGEMLNNKLTKMPFDKSTGKDKVIDVSEASFGRVEGRSIYDYYMREYAGVNAQTGAAQWFVNFVDKNNNGTFDVGEQIASLYEYEQANPGASNILQGTTEVYAQATQKFLDKSAIPDIRGAFNLNAEFKGFFVAAQMLYSFGGYSYDGAYATLMQNGQIGGNNWHTDIRDRWQNPGDITNVPRLTSNRAGDTNYASLSSRFLTKSDYLVLNNVTVGYTVPKMLLANMGINTLQLSVSGDNLWINAKRDGFNPSTSETGSSNMYRYSPLSTITFGAKFNF
ncbi:SusC/RagA family TonB-linked outer membrane protein [Kaistella antarctica]|uniref:Outer membrane cobalamin receptor protein n=1 Tax=Kaistella antarctica TaxID=266748 RepID=A0A448NSF6_9FLAO|nr:SusC/RagA family TonB-linked outer membrane protein [Kaistella antarctica]SEV79792.1 TonB-linked outer membrane protein, SusC/RagA family [Kaistella antarctica]VEH99936.1 Outer membrane cobalamin receptor protein [Kaistella antarctica]